MANQVCMGALCQCSMGMAPASLIVLPAHGTMCPMPAANILDNKPMANVLPFAMCQSPANPVVAAATAAALGVLTPMPCVPMITAPWMPGAPTVLIDGMPALDNNSKLMCQWGGVIQITVPGQATVMVP